MMALLDLLLKVKQHREKDIVKTEVLYYVGNIPQLQASCRHTSVLC